MPPGLACMWHLRAAVQFRWFAAKRDWGSRRVDRASLKHHQSNIRTTLGQSPRHYQDTCARGIGSGIGSVTHSSNHTQRQPHTVSVKHGDSQTRRQTHTATVTHSYSQTQRQSHTTTITHNDNQIQRQSNTATIKQDLGMLRYVVDVAEPC